MKYTQFGMTTDSLPVTAREIKTPECSGCYISVIHSAYCNFTDSNWNNAPYRDFTALESAYIKYHLKD